MEAELAAVKKELEVCKRRLKMATNEWQRLDKQARNALNADIICDFISTFYHHELIVSLRAQGHKFRTWSEISIALSREFFESNGTKTKLKDACCLAAGLTQTEWDEIYDFKKNRNIRVHPHRSRAIVRRVLADVADKTTLHSALEKMFSSLKYIS